MATVMARATTLADRLREVLARTGWSEREWSMKAGLSEGYVQAILRRERQTGKASGRVDELRKLAGAAAQKIDIDYAWLAGEADGRPPRERAAEAPTAAASGGRYPNRATALSVLGDALHPRARAVLEGTELVDKADLSVDEWIDQAKIWHRKALEVELELTSIGEDVARRGPPPAPGEKPGKRTPPRA